MDREKSLQTMSKVIVNLIKADSEANITHNDIIGKLSKAYIEDSNLGKQYEVLREETDRNFTTPKFLLNATAFTALTDDRKKEILEAVLGPKLILLQFTQELFDGTNQNYQLVAEACFRFAKEKEHFERIQNLFEQALKDTARFADKKSSSKQMNTLFANLKQKIIHDVNLKIAMDKMKIVLPDKL